VRKTAQPTLEKLFADIPPGDQVRITVTRSGYKDDYHIEIAAHRGSGTKAPIHVKSGVYTSAHAGSPQQAFALAVDSLAKVRALRAESDAAFRADYGFLPDDNPAADG
jgi:hypothetical protein